MYVVEKHKWRHQGVSEATTSPCSWYQYTRRQQDVSETCMFLNYRETMKQVVPHVTDKTSVRCQWNMYVSKLPWNCEASNSTCNWQDVSEASSTCSWFWYTSQYQDVSDDSISTCNWSHTHDDSNIGIKPVVPHVTDLTQVMSSRSQWSPKFHM